MTNLLSENTVDELYGQIEEIVIEKKNKVIYQINNTMLETYFLIGKLIVENEQNGNIHAEYGKQVLRKLSKRLIERLGSGFSRSNLQNMRLFYLIYGKQQPETIKFDDIQKCQPLADQFDNVEKCQTVSGKLGANEKNQTVSNILSWSHYCYLIYIEDDDERSFYEKECVNCNWSVRELKR